MPVYDTCVTPEQLVRGEASLGPVPGPGATAGEEGGGDVVLLPQLFAYFFPLGFLFLWGLSHTTRDQKHLFFWKKGLPSPPHRSGDVSVS